MNGYILLENGLILEGQAFGSPKTVLGEIVFNTGMTGYQEILTDPSYAEQIVVLTYPLIGNYGTNKEDVQSDKIQASGLIIRHLSEIDSNFKSTQQLNEYLKENNVLGITGIDTRRLTRIIRTYGTMKCLITTEEITSMHKKQLSEYEFPLNHVERVSIKERKIIHGNGKRIALVDLGVKKGIVDHLKKLNCEIHIYPYNCFSQDILSCNPDAVLFSNGPGDPKNAKEAITASKELLGKLPVFGICLGMQILALASGGDTYKLKFGHRGSNHPVIDLRTNKVNITAQNHGYAVYPDSMPQNAAITHLNVNDNTTEGFCIPEMNVHAVQYHPEAGPGPTDANYIFKDWIELIEKEYKNA